MSDALNYLLKVRKDAVEPYFKALKEGGKHLDTKTRSLLSVITKVDAQTEAGLKQYLVRALRDGNSADEILDAMLVCLPTLGMSKIIWAVDIILKMNIPDFNPELIGKEKQWHKLIAVNEIEEGVSRHDYDGRACFINKTSDEYLVYDSRCPHQAADISISSLEDATLTCSRHQWKFNVENGECIENGSRPLNRIEFKIEEEFVYVYS
ncbi:MAG: nitrite reductase/ring-hydroxylating ferredoxin subunit/alkylhydroperoxidase [Gammaproteobacteria bacterium]|jgi:nitrite reductase/ring-hydroxylating ferredoxin subunit/alkylhydroperoxidase/carboxymuconolactone decarboxylase family protein YurZ